MFLFIPHPIDVCGEFMGSRVDRDAFPHYDPRNLTAPLERMAARLEAPFVSLYDVYRQSSPRDLFRRGGDDHWNAAGQLLAARTMAEYVVAHGFLAR